jgi:hypothetical protein
MRPTTASTVRYSRSGHRKDGAMINGAHAILYSDDAAATRATLAKVLGTRTVDAGGGWHQHRVRIAEVLKELVRDVVADCVGIPDRMGEQVLHAIRVGSPACSARVQQLVRDRLARSPRTNARARRRGSTLVNRPAMRLSSSSRVSCQRAGVMLWPAAIV